VRPASSFNWPRSPTRNGARTESGPSMLLRYADRTGRSERFSPYAPVSDSIRPSSYGRGHARFCLAGPETLGFPRFPSRRDRGATAATDSRGNAAQTTFLTVTVRDTSGPCGDRGLVA